MINTILNKSLNISSEEKFLINILFKERKIIKKEIDFDNINYELLVKIASEHLMLPSLYFGLLMVYISFSHRKDFPFGFQCVHKRYILPISGVL